MLELTFATIVNENKLLYTRASDAEKKSSQLVTMKQSY